VIEDRPDSQLFRPAESDQSLPRHRVNEITGIHMFADPSIEPVILPEK
jgi:hypothetical protein